MLAYEASLAAGPNVQNVLTLSHLQNGEFVHLLPFASRYHILQHPELFVHFGSPSTLDQTMCSFASNLSTSRSCATVVLFPLPPRLTTALRSTGLWRRAEFCRSTLGILIRLWLHLYDLTRSGGRRRQCEVVLRYHRAILRGRSFP